jgi:hypothetical protein
MSNASGDPDESLFKNLDTQDKGKNQSPQRRHSSTLPLVIFRNEADTNSLGSTPQKTDK